jgi:hypothetical protein
MARHPRPTRRHLTGAAALLLVLTDAGGLAGCAQAGGAADQAKRQGSNVAAKAVEAQICSLVKDGALSPAEIESLGKVLDRAHSLGLPDAVLNPVHEIVSTGFATPDEIKQIRGTCPATAG